MPSLAFNTAAAMAVILVLTCNAWGQRQMEKLDRGLVAVRQEDGGVFVSWRLLSQDQPNTAFNVYRHSPSGEVTKINPQPITSGTNLVDQQAADDEAADAVASYEVRVVDGNGQETPGKAVSVWRDGFLEIPIDPIEGYRPGDASIGDLDGDGVFEIVLHQVSRGRDNSMAGITGQPVLDAYRLDGRRLWRINLGKNIREGEHYTQFMVYDLDGDGRAEVACKTADGAIDGQGEPIGDAEKDWRTIEPGSPRHGRVLEGPEYLTVFDGKTGAALHTVDYVPGRDPIDGWGGIGGNAGNDSYGNRCDRFLACVAYLDGVRPSLVMCRGVYGRIAMTAWDWQGEALTQRWSFDTGVSYPPFRDATPYAGMGGHSLAVGDIDTDGRDEIVYQAMVVDDDGQGLYSTGLRHGDAMHLTDIDPDRDGQEIFTVQENERDVERFQTPAAAMRDARTGELLWSHSPTIDAPNGLVADIDPRFCGQEAWGGPGGLRDARGNPIGPAPRQTDWCLWWDGDPMRELLSCGRYRRPRRRTPRSSGDRSSGDVKTAETDAAPSRAARQRRWTPKPSQTLVRKWNWQTGREETIFACDAIAAGRGPALLGDLIGDWREEILLVAPDRKSLRLYTTTLPTTYRLTTLLEDPQYRLALVWQNVVYNKPPHPSFYLSDKVTSSKTQE